MQIEGDYSLFAHLETVYLGVARRGAPAIMRNVRARGRGGERQADPVLPRAPRPLARADRRRLGGAHRRRDRRAPPTRRRRGGAAAASGPSRTALIAAFDGDTVAAARAWAERFAGEMNVTVLVDFENDSVRTALEVAEALGERLWGVRLDTSELIVDRSLLDQHGRLQAARRERGARAGACATRSTRPATGTCTSWSPAASTPRRSRASSASGVPVDAYGVGSSLVQGANDFTADVVESTGRDCAKAGRRFRPNPRLEASQLGLMSRPRMADWGSG